MKTALITGGGGFAGRYLTAALLLRGWKVISADRSSADSGAFFDFYKKAVPSGYQELEKLRSGLKCISCDVTSENSVRSLFLDHSFSRIFHLAGLAFIPDNTRHPALASRLNTLSPLLILETAKENHWEGEFLYVSSGDLYSRSLDDGQPITEESILELESPYTVTKWAAEKLIQYYNSETVRVFTARPFNHTGPGQKDNFVTPAFISRIRQALSEGKDFITTGDLRSGRDFSDVRDTVEGYITITEKGIPGEIYNVCSGKALSIQELLSKIMNAAGVSLRTETDPALLRNETPGIRLGSSAKLRALGWEPRIPLERTIQDIWNYKE